MFVSVHYYKVIITNLCIKDNRTKISTKFNKIEQNMKKTGTRPQYTKCYDLVGHDKRTKQVPDKH